MSPLNQHNPYHWVSYYANGKPHNNYNWKLIIPQVYKILDTVYKPRGITPILREGLYQLVSRNMLPKIRSAYTHLSQHLTAEKKAGRMNWGTFADEGRRTVENYPKYESIEDYVEYFYDGLINSPETYQIPRWYKQSIIVEVWLEKESLTGTFNALLADRNKEINVRKCKGFDGWEAAAFNFLQIARIMEAEDQNKFVVILYWGDQDPSGEEAFKHLMAQVNYFRNMTYENKQGKQRRFLGVNIIKIGVNMRQISQYNLPYVPDQPTIEKLLGTSIAKGDAKDKRPDSNTKKYIKKYRHLIKPGDMLPPLAEIESMISNDELIEITGIILNAKIDFYFDNDIYQQQLADYTPEKVRKVAKRYAKSLGEHFDL